MSPLTTPEYERMVAAAMYWLRERRHIMRQELESEKVCREMVTSMLDAAREQPQ